MPDFLVPPISIVNQIRNNLHDRYESGFPILKELLQNADDSRSKRFRVETLQGWKSAENPLLRWPGLLVVNDGKFRSEDEEGIISFGESSKTADSAVIGKFGLGQKAVFHICDAFAVYAYDASRTFSRIVNPFLNVQVTGNKTRAWESQGDGGLAESDLRLLESAASPDFADRGLILWFPFRRAELRPAPDLGFSPNAPNPSETIEELARLDDLALIVTALRHLEKIEIREDGVTRCALHLRRNSERLHGPTILQERLRKFSGAISIGPGQPVRDYVAREAILADGKAAQFQHSPFWPKTLSVLDSNPKPEKGAPHGAVTLFRAANAVTSTLRISWAVFLPISDSYDIEIPLSIDAPCQVRILFHGYFFLDSGRRRIEGLDDDRVVGDPADSAALRRAWNAELRDSAVLPLVPAVLRDALDSGIYTSLELKELVRSIAQHRFYLDYRRAICRTHALVWTFEEPDRIVWRTQSSEASLRPLPPSVAASPKRIEELFPVIHAWAGANAVVLCVDMDASLTASPMNWIDDDLDALFEALSHRAFQAGALAPLLAEFLDLLEPNNAVRQVIGSHLVAALRRAMDQSASMAPSNHLARILTFIPERLLFPLPPAVEHRGIFKSLAAAETSILPVRASWLGDTPRSAPRISSMDLKPLLETLEPHLEGGQADQAAVAALACLDRCANGLSDLAVSSELASTRVLRARDVRAQKSIPISLDLLVERSRAGLLFASSPDANRLLPLVIAALPDVCPLIVEQKTAEFLRSSDGVKLSLCNADKSAIFRLVNAATRFGPEQARLTLIEALRPSIDDDRAALRRLCAGVPTAGFASARFRTVGREMSGIESIITKIFSLIERTFLVPLSIASEMPSKLRGILEISELDTASTEALFEEYEDSIDTLAPTSTECEVFLRLNLSDGLLRRLPIHMRSDDIIGGAEDAFVEADFAVPISFRDHVLTIKLHNDPDLRRRQIKLVKPWTPTDQIEVALSDPEPHRFRTEILDALATLFANQSGIDSDTSRVLFKKRWLIVQNRPIAPEDVLALPTTVDETARVLLGKTGEAPPFEPVGCLSVDIRQHPAFDYLRERILPNKTSSFEALALLVEEEGIVGRPGPADGEIVEDLALLVCDGHDLGFPGWELISAGLAALKDDPDQSLAFVKAFAPFDSANPKLAALVLDTLSELAEDMGRTGEAARRVYRCGFRVVAQWPRAIRSQVFAHARVPTRDGGWRTGREVIEEGTGIHPDHLLASDYASTLPKCLPGPQLAIDEPVGDPVRNLKSSDSEDILTVDLLQIETAAAAKLRCFLRRWRSRLPADLIVVFLGLLGRNPSLRTVAEEWSAETTTDIDTIWKDLDRHFPLQVLYPNPLPVEVEQRRYVIKVVSGETVPVEALSGDLFDAPLGSSDRDILIGNLHKTSCGIRDAKGRIFDLITLPLRVADPKNLSQTEAAHTFRRLIELIAADCLRLMMSDQQAALAKTLDKAETVDQTTLDETEHLLQDQLPAILSELKLPTTTRAQEALRDYQRKDSQLYRLAAPIEDRVALKSDLWQAVSHPDTALELLSAVRAKIGEYGYSSTRVLFELFQNADDAYRQQGTFGKDACFRVEVMTNGMGGFKAIHWGRPVNHLGRDSEDGLRRGHGRDLHNMLLMNFSDKRPGDDLTGKFGLGFKSVHVLSESVGIASGFIALRTVGGFLPTRWPSGLDLVERHRSQGGKKATLIDVPFSAETSAEGRMVVDAFRTAMSWLPACASAVRRIQFDDGDTVAVECVTSDLFGEAAFGVVSIRGGHPRRALRFDLEEGFQLFIAIEADGPRPFPSELARLWNLAPLEEEVSSGWLLNGPFAVDPGRGRLAGTAADRQRTFARLGRVLAERLLTLYDLSLSDWPSFAEALHLHSTVETAQPVFWSLLFDLLQADFDDELIIHLHVDGRGFGHVASVRPVVPTQLPRPFDAAVRASDVVYYASEALMDNSILEAAQAWQALSDVAGRIVALGVAQQLRKLDFKSVRPLTLAELLTCEMGQDNRVDPVLSGRLGKLLSSEAIERDPLHRERTRLLEVASQALFLSRDGAWRPVRHLSSKAGGSEEEIRLSRFAPDSALLSDSYEDSALEFFKVARSRSGYGPGPSLLLKWANGADSTDRRRAVLRYVIEGNQGVALAGAMRSNFPPWVPQPVDAILTHTLLGDWTDEDRKDLLFKLGGHHFFDVTKPPHRPDEPHANPEMALKAIHTWWCNNGSILRTAYADRIYPSFFSPKLLIDSDDRTAWFTIFALGCFQSLGRTQDGQHRSYIEGGWRDGWWPELALSRPPDNVISWVERLEYWSSAKHLDQDFLPWRRLFVDLYAVARWLDQYIEIVRNLPRIVEEHDIISLNSVLRPSYSPAIQRLGIDAAPIARSLGIGINWIIRELLRCRYYETCDERLVAPYCWASTGRVRELLFRMGANVAEVADADESRAIHEFVVKSIGPDQALFGGDFDLPLHEITRQAHRSELELCLAAAGYATDAFEPTGNKALNEI